MNWTRDLPSWPLSETSRQIAVAPHRWHVQETGKGPTMLLLPGSGASTHTWRALIPRLSEDRHVITLDLPGHGFTRSPTGVRSGLNEMAADIDSLAIQENWDIDTIIGHSAGAAIALRLVHLRPINRIIGINAALDNFQGVAGWLFPLLARLLALNPFTASLFSVGASTDRAKRLIKGTGSTLDAEGYAFYARLMQDRDHVRGALNMMARWSLDDLLASLPNIETPCLFITGKSDKAVPPDVSVRMAQKMPNASTIELPGLGHLAHEEDPQAVLSIIDDFARFSD